MNFSRDPSKWAQEVIFNLKINRPSHPPLVFNNSNVIQTHSSMILDYRLTSNNHFENGSAKVNRGTMVIRKLQ